MQQEYNYTPLPEPIPITEQVWPEGTLPLVCTSTLAYNHEPYIRECLDGILMQKTTFPVQVLVHEDCSTDRTAEILKEYQAKYPNLIKVFYQPENVYSLKDQEEKRKRREEFFSWRIGKYVALCEGDDYWIDPLKLQKQVDFLEANPNFSLCFHAHKNLYIDGSFKDIRPHKIKEYYEMKDAILGGGGFMATNSMLFKKEYILEQPDWMKDLPVGDLPLMLLLASKGEMGYINDVMSVYRVMSSSSSWSASMKDRNRRKLHHKRILLMWDDFDRWTGNKYYTYVLRKKCINKWGYFKGYVKHLFKR